MGHGGQRTGNDTHGSPAAKGQADDTRDRLAVAIVVTAHKGEALAFRQVMLIGDHHNAPLAQLIDPLLHLRLGDGAHGNAGNAPRLQFVYGLQQLLHISVRIGAPQDGDAVLRELLRLLHQRAVQGSIAVELRRENKAELQVLFHHSQPPAGDAGGVVHLFRDQTDALRRAGADAAPIVEHPVNGAPGDVCHTGNIFDRYHRLHL